ncbi:MAG: ArsB/NhaD family transporter [Methanospirillum sp.]
MDVTALAALALFLAVYALIVDERIHRALAAVAGGVIAVAAGLVPWEKVPVYLDLNTLLLLAGMMVIVALARDSGLFDWLAIRTARAAGGRPFRLLVLFMVLTALVSALLDNVTTVLLVTPMLLYIADHLEVDPLPYLLGTIFASNIGGTATLIGDPPNILIGSAAGLSFGDFLGVMGPIVAVDMGVLILIIYLLFRRRWSVTPYQRERIASALARLDPAAAITDPVLLKKSVVVIAAVILLFLAQRQLGLEPAVIALLGATALLAWSRRPVEQTLDRVEWSVLAFFGGLFLVVGALVETGVIHMLAMAVLGAIGGESEAILLIAWFSAIASALVDNIPLTATMIPLIRDLGSAVDTTPLWWALSLGACLGGNGTAIGASANVVVVGLAEEAGYPITFRRFLPYGLAVMVATVAIGSALLVLMFGA